MEIANKNIDPGARPLRFSAPDCPHPHRGLRRFTGLALTRLRLTGLALAVVGLAPGLLGSTPGPAEAAMVSPREGEGGGVVVEWVGPGSAPGGAGLRPGDRLDAWERPGEEGAGGEFRSPFDWQQMVIGQAPRGAIRLRGEREGEPLRLEVPTGFWEARVRPTLAGEALIRYEAGREAVAAGQVLEGAEVWRRLGEESARAGDPLLAAWLSLRAGEVAREARYWEPARQNLETALALAPTPESRMASREGLAVLALHRNDFAASAAVWESLIDDSIRDTGTVDELRLAHWRIRLAEVLLAWSENVRAREVARTALEALRRLAPRSPELIESLRMLAASYRNVGEIEPAEPLYLEALELARALAPEGRLVAILYSDLGICRQWQGQNTEAVAWHEKALTLHHRLGLDDLSAADTLNNLGINAYYRADYDQAEEFYRQALAIRLRVAPGGLQVASSWNNLGLLAAARGELEEASKYLREALEIKRAVSPTSLDVAHTANNLGLLTRELGDLPAAEEWLREALKIYEADSPESITVANTRVNLGMVAAEQGHLAVAGEAFAAALPLQRRLAPGSLAVAKTLVNLAEVDRLQGEAGPAVDHFAEALDLLSAVAPGSFEMAATLHALGRAETDLGHRPAALGHFEHSLEVIEAQIWKLGGSQELKGRYRAEHAALYQDALVAQLDAGHFEDAFRTLERSRGQSFLALLAERELTLAGDVPEELEAERRELAARHDAIFQEMTDLGAEADRARLGELTGELAAIQRRFEGVKERIVEASPRFAAIRYPEALSVSAVRQVLDPGTVLLAYSIGERESALFVLSREGLLTTHRLAVGREELAVRIERLLRRSVLSAAAFESPARRRDAADLYRLLIEPAAGAVTEAERVLLVPDGPLHRLPFGALVRELEVPEQGVGEGTAGADARPWRYLIEEKPLHTVLSTTVYAELRKQRPRPERAAPTRLAAFADPIYPTGFGNTDPEGGSAPASADGSPSLGDEALRSAAQRGFFRFQPLPHTRLEVEEIAALFPPESATLYLGAAATEEKAKTVGAGVRYLHFATHAVFDDRLPLNSALALTVPETFQPGADNGLLQAWEIFEQVHLEADLVVLSGCDTALGEELTGEGLIGLSRAFQYAGARSVLASLWSVPDTSTAELMRRFYGYLSSGLGKDEALRQAQLELIRGPIRVAASAGEEVEKDASAPFYWAAFELLGDWR